MHISEALIDEATGGLIAPGKLDLIDISDIAVPAHDHVLLLFEGSVLICRPVTGLERQGNGLCRIASSDLELRLFAMSAERFDSIIPTGADPAEGSVSFRGDRVGIFVASDVHELQHYTLEQSVSDLGLTVAVAAAISERIHPSARGAARPHGEARLTATLDWATLNVRALRCAALFQTRHPSAKTPPARLGEIAPAHWRLEGLRLAGEDLLTPGHISLSGPADRTIATAMHIVAVRWLGPSGAWDRAAMSFRDCERAELRADGFCTAFDSEHWLDLLGMDFRWIEALLSKASSARVALEGASLGHLFLDPGTPGGGHGGNRISQPIVEAAISVALTPEGLRFRLDGTLGPFEQRRLDQYARRGQPVTTQPYDRVEVEVTAPWIWLLIYSPKLGARRAEFGVQ